MPRTTLSHRRDVSKVSVTGLVKIENKDELNWEKGVDVGWKMIKG